MQMNFCASVQFRPQNRDLGMVMREVDEDLAIFLGMRNGEKKKNDHRLIEASDEFDDSNGVETKPDSLFRPEALQLEDVQIVADDNLLNSENDKNDYDWLLPQRDDISLLPSEKLEGQGSLANQIEISNGEGISLKSELANTCEVSGSGIDSSAAANRRPLSSGGRKPAPRSATPTGRRPMPAKSKPSRASTPTSRATLEPSRASTTTSRATLPSSKPMASQSRSLTPSRGTSRSSTPASRPTIPASTKSASRSTTPTRKPATPSTTSSISASVRSSSGLKNAVPTRGTSQTVKSRPSKPSEMLSLSHDAVQNPRTSIPKRPASASRGRPSSPATRLSSSKGKPRQKSCSPAKTRASNATAAHKVANIILSRSRGHGSVVGDDVNPVLMGTKMVERVVNMRKLAPPKQDESISLANTKKSSQDNLGFGRSLSKRSLDMAIRHMDIRRSISDSLRPVATAVSLSSKSSVSESPLASGSDSSKSSNCINSYFLDGNRIDD
ncbi:hypothetical protein CDL12_02216 [Handroanthus impetiginosus]|uniref:Uncharacterized protein n=1 Tax=Handroanthus impetiginosus TaxID=429701 RepID=A0A2G9I5J7_9LAMI|nr:hypothetical protein CDL12_02216 [Handroanthus impetiginosus]